MSSHAHFCVCFCCAYILLTLNVIAPHALRRQFCCCADHFRHEHYLCNHQTCLDRKFIVFMTEQELKQHAAREHGGDMSKAERRQALTIPINFQVCPSCAHKIVPFCTEGEYAQVLCHSPGGQDLP